MHTASYLSDEDSVFGVKSCFPFDGEGGNVFKSCPLFKVLSIFPSDQPRDQLFGHLMMITFYFQILIEIRLSQLNNVELEIKRKTSKARRYVGRNEKPPHIESPVLQLEVGTSFNFQL